MFKTLTITNDTDCFTTSISRFTGKTAIRKGPGSIMADFLPKLTIARLFINKLKRCLNKECCKQCRYVIIK